MTAILSDLPFYDHEEAFFLGSARRGAYASIWKRQIPLRISLSASASMPDIPSAASFPAILDTGFNSDLVLTARHFLDWAGWSTADLARLKRKSPPVKIRGMAAIRCETSVWLHPNRPNTWDRSGRAAWKFVSPGGIFILDELSQPTIEATIRLPLIGMKLFEQPGRKCRLQIDFATRLVQLRI